MQDLFNLINIRQMYSQEGKLSIVESLDKLISIILDQMVKAPEATLVTEKDPVPVLAETKSTEHSSVSSETKSTVPNVFA